MSQTQKTLKEAVSPRLKLASALAKIEKDRKLKDAARAAREAQEKAQKPVKTNESEICPVCEMDPCICETGQHVKENKMPTFFQLRASLVEKTLTPAEKKKREEVAQAIERENPGMPMAKKMAIATATAKKVAEESELEEAQKIQMHKPGWMLRADPKLAAKFKEKENMHKTMAKYAGKSSEEIAKMRKEDVSEEVTSKEIKMAAGVAKDKRYAGGNMTGAVKTIEKIRKNLSQHPKVQQALRQANEEVETTKDNPLVTVHKDGELHTHANLSVANDIHATKVKAVDVHKGPVKVGNMTFAISMHHAKEVNKTA